MHRIETEVATATILDEQTVLVRARPGVEINARNARKGDQLIADTMPGPYGQIIDRREDYSVAPVEVFSILNDNPKLVALAIIAHRSSTLHAARIDQRLFRGALEVFTELEAARRWLEEQLRSRR